MSELGEALEADAIIQALGVFFFQRFSLELSIAMCDASLVLKFVSNDNWVISTILSIRDRSVRVGTERLEAKPYNLQKI
jgi:hypothetical protein